MATKVNKISELERVLTTENKASEIVLRFFHFFKISRILKPYDDLKIKGYAPSFLIMLLCVFRLKGQNIHQMAKCKFNDLYTGDDNALYRFKNSSKMNWRKLQLSFCTQFLKICKANSALVVDNKKISATKNVKCFILDDTDVFKTGKAMELCSKIYCHVNGGTYHWGYKLLKLALWTGTSIIPVDFSVHREAGKNKNYGLTAKELKAQFLKYIAPLSPGLTRRNEADQAKTVTGLEMLKRAMKSMKAIQIKYVLMDSWFVNDTMISGIKEISSDLEVLGMCKMDRRAFDINGKKKNSTAIIASNSHTRSKECRKHKLEYFVTVAQYKGIDVKLFYVKCKGQNKYKMLLTTDLSLNFTKAFEIYQIRWSIEVLFKECKQYLGLQSCQSRDFDAQIADMTLAFITHIILALEYKFSHYETLGSLFHDMQKNMLEANIWEQVLQKMKTIIEFLLEMTGFKMEGNFDEVIRDLMQSPSENDRFEILYNAICNAKSA